MTGPAGGPLSRIHPFLRYAAVGVVATGVHFALMAGLIEAWRWAAWLASGAGAAAGAQVAFLGNRHLTFAHTGPWWPAWWRFMGTAAFGAAAGMVLVAGLVQLGLHYLWAQASATVLILFTTFVVHRAWSFGARR